MASTRPLTLAAACALVAALAGQAWCESRHFLASQRHFEDIASLAAGLAVQVDASSEKNLCNYFTATAMAYSIRAHAMAQLADISDSLPEPEPQAVLARKLAQTREFVSRHVDQDLKAAEGLAASSNNSRIRKLGMRLVNELRVFQHNVATMAQK